MIGWPNRFLCIRTSWRDAYIGGADGVDEMITFSQVNGMMLYVDPWGKVRAEDVFSKIDLCKKHFAAVGLGEDFVNQFIR